MSEISNSRERACLHGTSSALWRGPRLWRCPAGGAVAQAKDKLKVGFIYVGPVGDHGWSYQHDQGRQAIEKAFPATRSRPPIVESVPEADSERAIEQLARTGHGLIFTTSFGFMEPTLKVAKKYPNIKFEHATGFKRAPNLSTYAAKFHEGRYIIGQIAGKMTKTGTIGYVGAFPIPEVVSGINAYFLGAQSVNPNVKIKVVWANSWYDPAKEGDAAKALLDQGVDVLAQHTDSPAPIQAAEARGKLRLRPGLRHGALRAEGAAHRHRRQLVRLLRRPHQGGSRRHLEVGGHLGRSRRRHGRDVALQEHARRREEDGRGDRGRHQVRQAQPLQVPGHRQDGKEIECKGNGALSDEQVLGMNFYVKGIDDKIPQ